MEDGRSVRTVDLATDSLNGQPGTRHPPIFGTRPPEQIGGGGSRSPYLANAVKSSTFATSTLTPGPIVEEITSCLM
jgi:hypothetical protein